MIKITYDSNSEKMNKPEKTLIRILKEKMFVQYNVPNKAKSVVEQMRKDGRKNVLFSRGQMIQWFPSKSEKQILEIVKKDIDNGVYIAEKKTGTKIKIENLKIEYEKI